MRPFIFILFVLSGCAYKAHSPDAMDARPSWLKTEPFENGYYTGIGHSIKDGTNNYIQSAKKSAFDDLVSEIKVTVSSTSVLNTVEIDRKLQEQYQQMIQTTATDDIQEFELVDAWEDERNYWVYYRLSIARYREIKEEQKRNATVVATDYLKKGRVAEKNGEHLQALTYYFQALRSLEKYLGEAITINLHGVDVLLVNETHASVQRMLNNISIQIDPAEIVLNRRINSTTHPVVANVNLKSGGVLSQAPLKAAFEKGEGDVFPAFTTDANGVGKILINSISSKDLEQIVSVKLNLDALSDGGGSSIYQLIVKTLNAPVGQVMLKVQRPVVYLTSSERSLGSVKQNAQIMNKLKNLLANDGFEFTNEKNQADLWFDVTADSEKGSVSGSIYITYLTSVIRVTALKEGKEIYATTLDRIKGYGLDYNMSSVDAYNNAIDALEKERMREIIATVMQ